MIPIIVQARMSSERLPGKVMLPWGDTTLIGHILTELLKVDEPIWVATSTDPTDDPLVDHVLHIEDVQVYRGELEDVLGRFVGCIDAMGDEPDAIVRVCGDRPFVNHCLVKALISYWERTPGLTALAPDDISTSGEVIAVDMLRWAREFGPDEHVTSTIAVFNFPTAVDTIEDYHPLLPC